MRNFSARRALCCALILALLLAQWAGMVHRVEHMFGEPAVSVAAAGDKYHPDGHGHSCIEFDAATLAHGLCTPVFLVPVLPNHYAAVAALAYLSAQVRLRLHFFSHAPPAR